MQLTHGTWSNIFPNFWSADGKTIYAIGRRGSTSERFNIWAISVGDGSARKLTDFQDSSKELIGLSSDGKDFFLLLGERVGDIWVAELASSE